MTTHHQRFDAVVVGAGFAGLYMIKRLLDSGFTVRAYEAGDGVGGTWYWNRYPGARCDLESVDYSYSFSAELEQEWHWSERYASQPEILRYLDHVADRFELRPHIVLGTSVTSAVFDETRDSWTVTTDKGEQVEARYCIMATGVLSTPKPPEIDGLETFAGPSYHTGRWPHEGVDFTGRRVALVGTGSSGVQSIPLIAEQAAELVVFQRTANYTVPSVNYPLDATAMAAVRKHYPERRALARRSRFGVPAQFPTVSALAVEAEERQAVYQQAWDESHLLAFRLTFGDILTDEKANDTVADFLRAKIGQILRDPDTARKLMPRSYPFGTKRPCLGNAYYETFNRDNVTLVDVRSTPIVRATPRGIETSDAEYEADSLVFATGWDALTGAVLRIDVRGLGNVRLRDQWAAGPLSYLGLAVSDFPNLFLVTGPGSPGPLSNMVVSIEQHVEWIGDCLDWLRDNGVARITADADAERAWFEHVQEVVAGTLYLRADSWYLGANVPGKPRVFMPYVGGVGVYRAKCEEVAAQGYTGFQLSARAADLSGTGA
ncbi:flavin-containing monooxygenase [Streptomyces sp. cg40]|uniref:flavin-containing monooxygenase n=1 Tax=Streptomyces sp. cg40 TaxID=3419764 RepID=UPI003D06950F